MENFHQGHRERMKKRFLKCGLEHFQEHEILEMLLYFTIPRRNTNEIAHRLIQRFGNIANVFDADIEDLKQVNGISENSAIFLKMIPEMCKIYLDSEPVLTKFANGVDDLVKFAIKKYTNEKEETLKIVYLNSNFGLICCDDMGHINNITDTDNSIRRIIERSEKYRSTNIVILYNKLSKPIKISEKDLQYVKDLRRLFLEVEIILADCIIIAKNKAFSLQRSHYIF